jgi:hypothetical protein
MALRADYTSGGKTTPNVYLRVDRIWGSKAEGWSSWVGVYATPLDKERLDTFSASVDFEAGKDPYPELYKKIATFHFLKNVRDDHTSVSKVKEEVKPLPSIAPVQKSEPVMKQVAPKPVEKKAATKKKK